MCSSVVVSLMLVYIRISEVIIKKLYSYGFYPGSELVSSFSWLILHHCCDSSLILVSSVQFSHSVVSNSLGPHELQHARPPCPSPTPGVHPNPCPSSWWCHPTISSSDVPFSSCPQSFPASGSFQMSQLFSSGGQSTGVSASASVLPVNTQGWSPLRWTGWSSCSPRDSQESSPTPLIFLYSLIFLFSSCFTLDYITCTLFFLVQSCCINIKVLCFSP